MGDIIPFRRPEPKRPDPEPPRKEVVIKRGKKRVTIKTTKE